MKKILAFLLALLLLTGCSIKQDGETNNAANQLGAGEYVALPQELELARQVRLELGTEAGELSVFAAAMERIRDQGLEYLSYGMTRQAAWCFAFVGGSVSSLRYAGELLLEREATGFSGWDTVGAISYCTPVPFLCEAIVAEHTGDTERAAACREMADYNFVYAVEGIDKLSVLTKLSKNGLQELVTGLIAFEKHIYWFYPADPQARTRNGFEWSAEYHLNLAGAYEELGQTAPATQAYLDALAADPFSPDVYALCAKAMFAISDVNLMLVYIEEGLLLDPQHGTLNTLAAMLWSAAGDRDAAQAYLAAARAAELNEEDAAICDAVDAFLKGG